MPDYKVHMEEDIEAVTVPAEMERSFFAVSILNNFVSPRYDIS
jgi:hypothetical protein